MKHHINPFISGCTRTSKDIFKHFGERKMWVGKTLVMKLVFLTRIWVRSSINPLVNWIQILLCPCKKKKKKFYKILIKFDKILIKFDKVLIKFDKILVKKSSKF
jgi:hypothetical protein